MEFRKWNSIGKFSDVYAHCNRHGVAEITYMHKIKLHGTNAAIAIDKGEVKAQKRTSFITPENDNCGFAAWVNTLPNVGEIDEEWIIYGEWAGPGIQKTDAVSMINKKHFFVFSIYRVDTDVSYVTPHDIEAILVSLYGNEFESLGIRVIPWYYDDVVVQVKNPSLAQKYLDRVMTVVNDTLSKEDPYIKNEFDVSGPGEGIVAYAIAAKYHDGVDVRRDFLPALMYKAKSKAHTVQKTRNKAIPQKPEGMQEFIEEFFTENRFLQMSIEVGGFDRAKTGEFIKAVMSDVYKESAEEIALADFEWKDVPRWASVEVKTWWFKQCDNLENTLNERNIQV